MATDLEPRERFAGPLREWFVDELRRPNDGTSPRWKEPPGRGNRARDVDDADDVDEVELEEPDDPRPRRWIVVANAAAVAAVLVGLLLVVTSRSGPSEPAQDDLTRSTVSTRTPASPPAGLIGDVCAAYAEDAIELPLGAAAPDVAAAADDLERRLRTARDELAGLPASAGGELPEAVRLLDDAIESAEQLRTVAAGGADRATIDRSVENVDLIVTAASGRLEAASGGACAALPTLRELQ